MKSWKRLECNQNEWTNGYETATPPRPGILQTANAAKDTRYMPQLIYNHQKNNEKAKSLWKGHICWKHWFWRRESINMTRKTNKKSFLKTWLMVSDQVFAFWSSFSHSDVENMSLRIFLLIESKNLIWTQLSMFVQMRSCSFWKTKNYAIFRVKNKIKTRALKFSKV